ncbi:MAG: hypothetical protein MW689_000815 [Thermodesulfobacteria bacterium]|nr:hypothetical protein [Thermodesulfobacteriota bacterium]MCU4139026.1 hypothetical protein [Thermodesulfobacteriota bacterium]
MIKDIEYLKQFEEKFISEKKLSYEEALKIIDALWEEGLALKVLPPKDPLEGIETDIKIARILNSCLKSLSQK